MPCHAGYSGASHDVLVSAALVTSRRKNEGREVAGQRRLCSKAHPARRVGFVSNVNRVPPLGKRA
jgi:hypothetical protein